MTTGHKSQAVSKARDPRSARTIAQLDAAFVALLARRSYSHMRVSDIARKARIGRATFYAHYTSKHALLRSQVQRFLLPMLREESSDPCPIDCTRFFEHVGQSPEFFRSLFTGGARMLAEPIVRDCVTEHVARVLAVRARDGKTPHPLRPDVIARFVAGSLLTLVVWWVETGTTVTPNELQITFRALVGRGLSQKG